MSLHKVTPPKLEYSAYKSDITRKQAQKNEKVNRGDRMNSEMKYRIENDFSGLKRSLEENEYKQKEIEEAIQFCSEKRNENALMLLIQYWNQPFANERTIELACFYSKKMINWYIEKADTKDKLNQLLFLFSKSKDYLKEMKILLEKGADPNFKKNRNITILGQAVLLGSKKMVSILLEHRAIIDEVAMDYCLSGKERPVITQLLLENGATFGKEDILITILNKHYRTLRLFIEKNKELFLKDQNLYIDSMERKRKDLSYLYPYYNDLNERNKRILDRYRLHYELSK